MKNGIWLLAVVIGSAACSGDEAGTEADRGRPPFMRSEGGRSATGEMQEISVKASRATRLPISTYILSNTTLEPIRLVSVTARVNALVEEITVEEGDRAAKGQTLVRLDDREIRNEFLQAKIAVEQSEIQARQAGARAEQSEANFERSERLRQQNLISRQDYDQTALTARTDKLAYEVGVQQFEAAKARLEAAQLQLEYTRIEAPIRGVITQRLIEVGDRVSPGQEVFRLEDFTPLWARIFVPERDLSRIRTGQNARIRIEAFAEKEFTGRVKMISPTVDAESGTVKVTLEVADSGGQLRPGMFGLVYIPTQTRPDALVIPKKAVLRERDESRVFVIGDNGTVEKRPVQLGISEEDRVEILSGLQEGDPVVTVGQESLNDGYPVKVLSWEGDAGEVFVANTPAVRNPEARPRRPGQEQQRQPGQDRRARGQGGDVQRPQGQRPGGGNRFGAGTPEERAARFQQMLERNPEWKRRYQEALKKDPDLATNPEKMQAFVRELFQGRRPQ